MVAALVIGGSLAAGHYLSARTQAKAAEKAAKIQQEGVREARAYGEPLYAQAQQIAAQQAAQGQARLAPYVQQGTQGLTALSAFLGVPSAPPAAGVPPAAPMAPMAPMAPAAPPTAPGGNRSIGGAILGSLTGHGGGGGAPGTAPSAFEQQVFGRPAGAAVPGATSGVVMLRAPTGETRPVPANQVDYFLARGAQRA